MVYIFCLYAPVTIMPQHTYADIMIEKLKVSAVGDVHGSQEDTDMNAYGDAVPDETTGSSGSKGIGQSQRKPAPSGWREKCAALLVAVSNRSQSLFTTRDVCSVMNVS